MRRPGADGPTVCSIRRDPMANKRGRDADSGQFIPVEVAERRRKTAIVETFKTDKNGRPLN